MSSTTFSTCSMPCRASFHKICKSFVSYILQPTRKLQTMLLYTFLHFQIHFRMIVFVFPMFAVSDEKTSQAYCDENHAWCEDVFSIFQVLDSLSNTLLQIKQNERCSTSSDTKVKPYCKNFHYKFSFWYD